MKVTKAHLYKEVWMGNQKSGLKFFDTLFDKSNCFFLVQPTTIGMTTILIQYDITLFQIIFLKILKIFLESHYQPHKIKTK